MVISRLKKYSIPVPSITLYGLPLEMVSYYKYLGVIISDDLSWSTHIDEISNIARKIVGLLYRQFSMHSSPQILLQLCVICKTSSRVCFTNLESLPYQTYQSIGTNTEICTQNVLQKMEQLYLSRSPTPLQPP